MAQVLATTSSLLVAARLSFQLLGLSAPHTAQHHLTPRPKCPCHLDMDEFATHHFYSPDLPDSSVLNQCDWRVIEMPTNLATCHSSGELLLPLSKPLRPAKASTVQEDI